MMTSDDFTKMMMKSVDFTKIQRSRYLENKTFFLQIKKSLITHHGLLWAKNSFEAEVTFK